MGRVGDMVTELTTRVLQAYGRVHPSMYDFMVWHISKENVEAVCKSIGVDGPLHITEVTIFGMPVKLIDSDEISLVLAV